jgi:uncharacterized membrane protein
MPKQAKDFFSKTDELQILNAIRHAESNTSGEIRVHIENKCKIDVLDRAAQIFDLLKMQKTELRNGVLFYLAVVDKKFAILGDAGINAKVKPDFWDEIKAMMLGHFKKGDFAEGLSNGIIKAGEQLKEHFEHQDDDVNELSDEISYS